MILVTGASGFIGRSLVRRLEADGREWRAYSGRINSPAALRNELAGVDTVIHLAGAEARGRASQLQHVDVEGTERVVEEARRAGVGRLIVPSRLNANPFDIHSLLKAKGEVERLVERSGLPYTILRSATLFGRDDRFTEIIYSLALWSWPFVWLPGGGNVAMQPLWVEDFVTVLLQAVDRDDLIGQTITVAGAERLRYRDVVAEIQNATDLTRVAFKLPMTLLRPSAAVVLGWWYWPAVSRFFVDRFFVPEVADLDSVQRQFGFQPARLRGTIVYLNRPGLRWRLVRH